MPAIVMEDAACSSGKSGWNVGADALLLVPRFESNPAYFVTTRNLPVVGLPPKHSQTVEEFGYDLSWSPRAWIGYTLDSGLGVRARWFRFDQDANSLEATNPAIPLGSPVAFQSISSTSPLMSISPQTSLPAVNAIQVQAPLGADQHLHFRSSLFLETWDFEATFSDLRAGAWGFELFGGLRYCHAKQSYSADADGPVPQFIVSDQNFNGVGPTLGIEAKRGLGILALAAYGIGRISFLFGEDEHASTGLNIGLVPDFTYAFHDDYSSRDRILPMIELELGVEGSQTVGSAEVYVRGGVFSQLVPLGSGANGNGNAGLIGLSMGGGVRF